MIKDTNPIKKYFPVFVFIGLSIWNFFNKMVVYSVKLVTQNRDTVTKVYLPKFILLFITSEIEIFWKRKFKVCI